MGKIFIKAGLLIDGTGREPEKNKVLAIENGVITDIANGLNVEGGEVYDYSDAVVMPGLINCHVHIGDNPEGDDEDASEVDDILFCVNSVDKLLKSGVTFIRNLGTQDYLDVKLKKSMAKGMTQKIGMVASGPFITMTGGHGHEFGIEADGVDECRKAARIVIKNGSDVVKIMATGGVLTPGVEPGSAQLSMEEIEAAVIEAHKADKRTATHAQGMTGIRNAVMAGIDSVEHGIYLTDEIIRMMVEKGTYLVPTLAAPYAIVQGGEEAGIPDYALRKSRQVIDVHKESFKKAYEAGVKIAMGTDAGTPMNFHDQTWLELKLMTDNGMTPMDAVVASTKTAAELLRVDDMYGTLETGKMADIVVVDENPLDNIDTLSCVRHVFKEGSLIK